MTEVFGAVMDLHKRLNLPSLNLMPGKVWRHTVDTHWFIVMNGNGDEVTDGTDEWKVPIHPYACAVWFNGFYAGEFDCKGGVLCAGSVANEDTLIEALNKLGGLDETL